MSGSPTQGGRDLPSRALAGLVALLPTSRRDWGQAMQAELAGIDIEADRWRFAAGCGLAIMRRPAPGALASVAVPVGIVAATVALTVSTRYLPMHLGLIAMVSVLGLVYLAVDRGSFLAPLWNESRLVAGLRAGGALAVAALALGVVMDFRSGDGNVVDRATTGVPIFTLLLACYLVGFLSLTTPAPSQRRILALGTGLGVAAAASWLAWVLTRTPLPLSNRSAFAVLAVAVLAAAVLGSGDSAGVRTALCAGLVGALSIFVLVHLVLAFGPAGWVPSDSAALTPAARLAQSRGEAGESYLFVFLVGALAAAGVSVDALWRHRSLLRSPHATRAKGVVCVASADAVEPIG